MGIRFHLDEHVAFAIASGLRRRRIDVTTTQDAGLLGASDDEQVRWCVRENRTVFTQDRDFLAMAATGIDHNGIIYNRQGTRTIGQIIEWLETIDGCMSEAELQNRVIFI
jgi:predicted nuclease of predicted toxin-antitoxin system